MANDLTQFEVPANANANSNTEPKTTPAALKKADIPTVPTTSLSLDTAKADVNARTVMNNGNKGGAANRAVTETVPTP